MKVRLISSFAISITIHITLGFLVWKLFMGPKEASVTHVSPSSRNLEYSITPPENVDKSVSTPENSSPEISHLHNVQPGESLWVIARQYNISIDELMEWNNIAPGYVLKVGDKLYVNGK